MSTTITRQGTSLAETSQEELQKLSAKAGVVPKSPAGAAAIGANPDVAKMAGTPAQKPSRIDGPALPPTLSQTQRITPQSAPAVTAPEKLDRMKQLGSLGTQVEGLVQGYLQQIQTNHAALSLNTETLGVVPDAQRVPLEAALTEYKNALTAQQKEAATIKAGNALGRPLSAAEMAGYFAGAPDALGKLANTATPESVSLRDLNLSAAGVNIPKLAADLGVNEDELQGLSLPQLNAKIEEIRQAEFAKSDAAAAESMSAVGNRATQLQGERQSMGQSGQRGYEAQFSDLQANIENASTINVAGQAMTIDKLLSDESLSKIISGAAISSTALAKLRETEPALADWISQYKASLVQLSSDAGLVASDVAARQVEASELKKDVSDELFTSIFGDKSDIMSSDELATLKADMQSSGLWQALSTDASLRTRLEGSPDAVDSLKALTKDQLTEVMAATKAAETLPVLGDLMGYTPGGILTPQQVDFVNTWKDELSALPPSISSNPKFQDLIKNGELNEAGASLLATSPELWDKYLEEQADVREVGRVKDEEQFLEMLTGSPSFGVEDFDDAMDSLKAWAATGDQKALAFYTQLKNAITGPDGHLDLADVQKAVQSMSAAGQGIGGVLEGKGGTAALLKKLSSTLQEGAVYSDKNAKVKMMVLDYLKNDERIDSNEMQKIFNSPEMGETFAKQLINEPWLPNKAELTSVFNTSVKQKTTPTLTPLLNAAKAVPGMGGLAINPDGTLAGADAFDFNKAVATMKPEAVAAYKSSLKDLKDTYTDITGRMVGDGTYAESVAAIDKLMASIDAVIEMQRTIANRPAAPAPTIVTTHAKTKQTVNERNI